MNKKITDKKRLFIKPQGLIVLTSIIVILALITINIFFKPSKQVSSLPPLKEDLVCFLENLMIREGGLYTLVGTKPITEFDVEWSNHPTEEGLQESYEELREFLKKAEREEDLPISEKRTFSPDNFTLPSYEEYKSAWEKQKDVLGAKELWDAWKNSALKIDPKFQLFSRKAPYGEGRIGLLVNIPNLVYILHRYKQDFCERTGIEFEPSKVLAQIVDEQSIFWEKVFHDHFLFGLVFGYGERSSYLFDWEEKHGNGFYKRNLFTSSKEERRFIDLMSKQDLAVSDLLYPEFVCFGVTDPTKIYYQLEREKIIEYFHGKDFIQTTLEILTIH